MREEETEMAKKTEQREPKRKFKDAAALRAALDGYFDMCDKTGTLYSEAGILLAIGLSSLDTWDSWWEGARCPDLMPEVRWACLRITNQILTHPTYREKGGMTSLAIFLLKQKRLGGMTDRVETKKDMTVNVKMGGGMDESDFK